MSLKNNNNPTSINSIRAIEALLQKPYGIVLFPNDKVKDNYLSKVSTDYTTMAINEYEKLNDPTNYLIEHINDLTRLSISKVEQVQLFGTLLQLYNNDNTQTVPVRIQNGLIKFLTQKELLYNSLDLTFSNTVDNETIQLRSIVNLQYSPANTTKLAMQLICQSLFKLIITNDRR
ncbi:hypothetical protein [Limosilactobacillus reuteri]|nr:hypothetical protein [Limosilactobacillus reuteri]